MDLPYSITYSDEIIKAARRRCIANGLYRTFLIILLLRKLKIKGVYHMKKRIFNLLIVALVIVMLDVPSSAIVTHPAKMIGYRMGEG